MASLPCLPWVPRTKLSALYLGIPLAMVAHCLGFGPALVFTLSLPGLAKIVNFLTEQFASFSGFRGMNRYVLVLLLVLGASLYHGGVVKLGITSTFKEGQLEIALNATLGSATPTFVVPFCATVAWHGGTKMDLDFNPPEIGFLITLPLEGLLPSFLLGRDMNGSLSCQYSSGSLDLHFGSGLPNSRGT